MNKFEAYEYIKLLAEHYPKAFFETRQRRLPLKIGIDDDLMKRGPITNPIAVADVLYFYTSDIGYQYTLRAGNNRVDLDGNQVEKVTEAEQRGAEQKIKEIQAILARKKQVMNGEEEEGRPRRVVIPNSVLPSDEQALFARIENLILKARSLRMGDEDIGAELAVKALELARAEVKKLIEKWAQLDSVRRNDHAPRFTTGVARAFLIGSDNCAGFAR